MFWGNRAGHQTPTFCLRTGLPRARRYQVLAIHAVPPRANRSGCQGRCGPAGLLAWCSCWCGCT